MPVHAWAFTGFPWFPCMGFRNARACMGFHKVPMVPMYGLSQCPCMHGLSHGSHVWAFTMPLCGKHVSARIAG